MFRQKPKNKIWKLHGVNPTWKIKCKVKLTPGKARPWNCLAINVQGSYISLIWFLCKSCTLMEFKFGDLFILFLSKVFVEGGKPEARRKTLWAKREQTTNTTHIWIVGKRNRTPATLVGGESSLHGAIPTPHLLLRPIVNLKRDIVLPSEVSEQIPDTVRNFPSVQLHSFSCARARQEYIQPWTEK